MCPYQVKILSCSKSPEKLNKRLCMIVQSKIGPNDKSAILFFRTDSTFLYTSSVQSNGFLFRNVGTDVTEDQIANPANAFFHFSNGVKNTECQYYYWPLLLRFYYLLTHILSIRLNGKRISGGFTEDLTFIRAKGCVMIAAHIY